MSDQRNAANARNAKHSSGPKTDDGKNRSRFNALKHGLTAKLVDVLPDEDQNEFDKRINVFLTARPDASPEQVVLMKRIVSADWKLDRLDQAQLANVTHKMRHAARDLDAHLTQQAEEVGQRLIYECIDRGDNAEWRNPIVQERIQKRAADHPKCLRVELERTVQGVDWLLERWEAMRGHLRFYKYWHVSQKFEVVRMLGKRPADALDDSEIGAIFVACRMIHPEPWSLVEECMAAKLEVIGRPMYHDQIQKMETHVHAKLFNDKLGAWKWLDALVVRQIERLTALRAELQPIAEADFVGAIQAAKFDSSKAGVALTRYEADLTRSLHRSVNDLMKQRKCDLALDDAYVANYAPSEVVETPVVESVPKAEEPVSRNEPIAEVAKTKPVARRDLLGPEKSEPNSTFVNVSAFRNEPKDDGKGAKTAPKPPR